VSERLLEPADAAKALARHLEQSWAERICAELVGEAEQPFAVSLRPGISGTASVERVGLSEWHDRLASLNPEEAECYAAIATAGYVATRRIEQERIDLADARHAMHRLLDGLAPPHRGAIYSPI
jgi:hypothetical protein